MNAMADKMLVRLFPELKQLIDAEATRLGIDGGMGEFSVQILAAYFKRPDLARVPRKKMGRPSKVQQPTKTHANGKNGTHKNGKVAV